MASERLKNKNEPISAPSLVKTERMFRQSSILEKFRKKLEDMGSETPKSLEVLISALS
jgi:hypothetical protein